LPRAVPMPGDCAPALDCPNRTSAALCNDINDKDLAEALVPQGGICCPSHPEPRILPHTLCAHGGQGPALRASLTSPSQPPSLHRHKVAPRGRDGQRRRKHHRPLQPEHRGVGSGTAAQAARKSMARTFFIARRAGWQRSRYWLWKRRTDRSLCHRRRVCTDGHRCRAGDDKNLQAAICGRQLVCRGYEPLLSASDLMV
jgi:hypothetical protein